MVRLSGSDAARPGPLTIVRGQDETVALWVVSRLPEVTSLPGGYAAIGAARDRRLVGGVVFTFYRPSPGGGDVQIWAAGDSGWVSRRTILAMVGWPFEELKCHRVTAYAAKRNRDSRRLLESLGFRVEGNLREGVQPGRDAIMYGMLASEWQSIKERLTHEQKRTEGT